MESGLKSIHFGTPPTMNGKRTMRFTDLVVENFKPKVLAAIHKQEMAGTEDEGVEEFYEDEHLSSWSCHWCEYREATGIFRPHHHEYD